MPLAMSRPWKHPQTGIYWLRKGVPEALREAVGKREEKISLRTRDPVEAKQRHAEALAEIEKRWANLRAGPTSLTERECEANGLTAEHPRSTARRRQKVGHRGSNPPKRPRRPVGREDRNPRRRLRQRAPCRKYLGYST
jgi:hypothetical protein